MAAAAETEVGDWQNKVKMKGRMTSNKKEVPRYEKSERKPLDWKGEARA